MFFIILLSSSAFCLSFINAPFPHVTSSTNLFAPAAIFLLIILELMSEMLSVAAIVSRKAYSFLSAGAKFKVCPIKLMPIFSTFFLNSSIVIFSDFASVSMNDPHPEEQASFSNMVSTA